MGKSLADAAKGSRDSNVVAYARLLSLTGKWLAETRCKSPCSADAFIAKEVKWLSLATVEHIRHIERGMQHCAVVLCPLLHRL